MENSNRQQGTRRLRASDLSVWDPYYIITYFISKDIKYAAEKFASGKLIDIGCGNKPYRDFFIHQVSSYTGCDIVQSSDNLVDDICPANKLCYSNHSFDTIFSSQVMEHVEDFQGMISEMYRVLKPNGYGIITVPFAWELHEEPYDFHRFSKYGLKYDFEKIGFDIIEIKPNGGKWASIFQLLLNVLFSTRKYRTVRSRLIKLFFIHLKLLYIYNKIGVWVDMKYFDPILTLNYLIVVRKKETA